MSTPTYIIYEQTPCVRCKGKKKVLNPGLASLKKAADNLAYELSDLRPRPDFVKAYVREVNTAFEGGDLFHNPIITCPDCEGSGVTHHPRHLDAYLFQNLQDAFAKQIKQDEEMAEMYA